MKITNIIGSPRKNSKSCEIAAAFCNTAEKNGAVINSYKLNEMNFSGCQGCYGCKRDKNYCVIKDDLQEVIEKISETDALVISTPIYIWDVPGQVKCFIDRLYSFKDSDWKTKLSDGKKVIFVQTQGREEGMFKNVSEKYEQIMKTLGFSEVHIIRACNFVNPNKEGSI
ncbi:MAG: flavodoxin family protein [Desulfobacterales bacterium]|nr:flavodoxin family protein [Desulfobacterales bacterium]